MLNIKVVGVGFGGTKGAIRGVENGIIPKEKLMIINSTLKDIPLAYEDVAAYYSRAYGGSAKERSSAKELCLDALKNDELFIQKVDSFVDATTEVVIFVVAPEGGTGSGSVPILAKYFNTVIRKRFPKLKIQIFTLNGFEDDPRGLQNTIEFFQELDESYTVQSISMKKLMDEDGLTRRQAEEKADDLFAEKIAIAAGRAINYENARHNIDESDLLKLSTTPGFMFTWRVSLGKLKNTEAFNRALSEAIDSDKSLDIPKQSIARLGVISHVSEKNEEFIDYKFPVIKSKLGTYFDIFIHDNAYVQGEDEYIEFVASGLKMPIDELKAVYEKYKKETQLIDTDKDDFFSIMNEFRGDLSTLSFDTGANKKEIEVSEKEIDKDDFFGSFMNTGSSANFKDEVAADDDKKDISKY